MLTRPAGLVVAALTVSLTLPGTGSLAQRGALAPNALTLPITIAMPAPANAPVSNAQYSTQDVWAGVLSGVGTPPSGISPLQRLANLNPPNMRLHAGTDGGPASIDLPFNAPYTSSDAISVAAWSFAHLNSVIQNMAGRTKGSIMLNVRYAPDNMFAGAGPMGGNGNAPGALLDQTYAAFATYMANLVKYYNSSTPPGGATPWPRPAGTGPIGYWEIWNEPDYSAENPRIPPSLPPPGGVMLSGVSNAGGTLVPGTTYTYRVGPFTSTNQEGLPSTAASIVLPAGSNAVRISWNPSTNLGRAAAAYTVFGRSGSVGRLVVVGKDNGAGLSWTDNGSVSPGGPPPAIDATLGGPVFSPLEYKALWDRVVPAMKAVDPTIKVVGPACTNPISLGAQSVVTTVVSTGPADTSYLDNRDYVQVLMTSANRPDVISYHAYGGYQGVIDSDSSLMSAIGQIAADVRSNILPYTGTTPIWHTEANVNSGEDTSNRPARAFGAAWDASLFANLAPLGISDIHQYTYVNSPSFGIITEPGSPVIGAVEGNPYLPYWVEYWIDHLLAPGAKILTVGNIPAGFDVLAVANPPDFTKVKVLVVNRQVPATNTAVLVQLAGATSVATRARVIDSTTDLVNGPAVANLGAVQMANLALNGYSLAAVEFDTGSVLSPVVTGLAPGTGPVAGGTVVTISGSGFSGATAVRFGGAPAASFTVQNDGTILATSPPACPGGVDVTVTTAVGTSTLSAADRFTFVGNLCSAVTGQQYWLAQSDGVNWRDLDSANLTLTLTPSANLLAIVSGNADLWTATRGVNQDLGITVAGGAYPNVPGQPEAWKESGGYAGTFSPNAAFVQTVLPLAAGTSYTIKLQWKSNIPTLGTIFAGAGGPAYSPTRLTVDLVDPSALSVNSSHQQYVLTGSGAASWHTLDPANLATIMTPAVDSLAVISGNADLWTATAGVNQDLGIALNGSVVAWKESGGFAGTFSPNAAFVQTVVPLTHGVTYPISLQWKTNIPASSATIVAGAGAGPAYSPTSLSVLLLPAGPNPARAVSNQQYHLTGSNGISWQDLDAGQLSVSFNSTTTCQAIVSGGADLWTAQAGFNQDLGINVNGGLASWKESGGFAGTFSPNAAFVQTVITLNAGVTYLAKLQWKTNIPALGATIYAGAGGPAYSPSSLTALLVGCT